MFKFYFLQGICLYIYSLIFMRKVLTVQLQGTNDFIGQAIFIYRTQSVSPNLVDLKSNDIFNFLEGSITSLLMNVQQCTIHQCTVLCTVHQYIQYYAHCILCVPHFSSPLPNTSREERPASPARVLQISNAMQSYLLIMLGLLQIVLGHSRYRQMA